MSFEDFTKEVRAQRPRLALEALIPILEDLRSKVGRAPQVEAPPVAQPESVSCECSEQIAELRKEVEALKAKPAKKAPAKRKAPAKKAAAKPKAETPKKT